MGKQLSPASQGATGQFPYLRVANVLRGRIDYADVKTMGFSLREREIYGLKPGDILLNEGQSLDLVGRSAIYGGGEGEFCFQNTLVRFRSGDHVLPAYAQAIFERWLDTGVFAAIAKQTTSIAHLGGERFSALKFPLLALAGQQRIIEVADALLRQERVIMALIEKLQGIRLGVLLDAMARMDLGKPPVNWIRVPLKEVIPKVDYGISEALDRDSRGVPVLRMNNINEGRTELTDLRYSPTPVPEKLELRHGDVLFNRTNSIDHIGKSCMWREEIPRATFASYLVRINPDTSRLIPEYLVEWLMHPSIRQKIRSISTVAVQQVNVNPTRLRELEIDMPANLAEQRRIVDRLLACDEQVESARTELAKLGKLKQGIVDDLLSGRVSV
ncbi:restriction endonuclease subunit S [Streptosporangium sp. NPDC049376]|uniref:restriction endonuclease subunit S n=1 Tax=Streptosporangium sp. NPDC049376 TaxID=3366192 RepID=UPI003798937B